MEFFSEYGLFVAKAVTIVVAILVTVGFIVGLTRRQQRDGGRGELEITEVNELYRAMGEALKAVGQNPAAAKQAAKAEKQKQKQEAKEQKAAAKRGEDSNVRKKRVYVIDFEGDIRASAVDNMRQEISAVLQDATVEDEVVVRLESPGGMVHSYGLASSQLDRIRKKAIPLTICVDKVAASGGYMMACVGNRILAAPFAVLGSIGVVAQIPNFHKILKKNDVDYELLTAGEYKRTLTMLGENTEKGRQKFVEDLEDTHALFKDFIAEHRPQVDLAQVATGEVWLGTRALHIGLVDELQTSDEYLQSKVADADVLEVKFVQKKKLAERLGLVAEQSADNLLLRWWGRLTSQANWIR